MKPWVYEVVEKLQKLGHLENLKGGNTQKNLETGKISLFPPKVDRDNEILILKSDDLHFLKNLGESIYLDLKEKISSIPWKVIFCEYTMERDLLLDFLGGVDAPVFIFKKDFHDFYLEASVLISFECSPILTKHGTLVNVQDIGIIISGPSGVGKSECALELISRGHALVSDDLVLIRRVFNKLYGFPPHKDPKISHHLEIRGLGIIDIKKIYGPKAFKPFSSINLLIELIPFDREQIKHLPQETEYEDMLEVKIPKIKIFVNPGKHIGVIVEAIALDFIMKEEGIDMTKTFYDHLLSKILGKSP